MGHGTCSPPAKPVGEMLRKSTDDFVCVFNYMNHDHNATGHSPFYLSHGYFPCKPRLALAPSPTRHQSMVHRWASTLASHLKTANSDAVSWDSQAKQRLVARSADEPTPFHAVMMHVPMPHGQDFLSFQVAERMARTETSSHPQNSHAQVQPSRSSLLPSAYDDASYHLCQLFTKRTCPRMLEPVWRRTKLSQASLDNSESCKCSILETA